MNGGRDDKDILLQIEGDHTDGMPSSALDDFQFQDFEGSGSLHQSSHNSNIPSNGNMINGGVPSSPVPGKIGGGSSAAGGGSPGRHGVTIAAAGGATGAGTASGVDVEGGARGGGGGWTPAFLTIDYYKGYFDIDTAEVFYRLQMSFSPVDVPLLKSSPMFSAVAGGDFGVVSAADDEEDDEGGEGGESTEEDAAAARINKYGGNEKELFITRLDRHVDLYGPFWVATTLVFVLGFLGNISHYLNFDGTSKAGEKGAVSWEYDFALISFAASAVYVYVILTPALVWALLTFMVHCKARLIVIMSLYGYSLFAYIPSSLICLITPNWGRWLLICASCVLSLIVLVKSFVPFLKLDSIPGAAMLRGGAGSSAGATDAFSDVESQQEQAQQEGTDGESGGGNNTALIVLCVVALFHVGFAFIIKLVFF
eukprot:Nk52_evm19s271 gene=Nk52_evmTU19s271